MSRYHCFLLVFPFVLLSFLGKGQCNLKISPDTSELICGDSILLSAGWTSSQNTMFIENFNDKSLDPPLWDSSSTSNSTPSFTGACPPGVDVSPFAWFGAANIPRGINTSLLDVSCGGEVCFDLRMAANSWSNPCDGPDLYSEGIYFECSMDTGNTWVLIDYFNPDINGSGGDSSSPYVTWDNYCFSIPDTAKTTHTKFRWYQGDASGSNNDYWGLDNISIQNECQEYWLNWGNGLTKDNDTLVLSQNDLTINALLTDTIGDTCYAQSTLNIEALDLEASTSKDRLCPGDTTVLEGIVTNRFIHGYRDDFEPMINSSFWSSLSGNVNDQDCGAVQGKALRFRTSTRFAQTRAFELKDCHSLSFCIKFGNDTVAPCETPEDSEYVELSYSLDSGTTWHLIHQYGADSIQSWHCFDLAIPDSAVSTQTMFKWEQVGGFDYQEDNWALDEVRINCTFPGGGYSWTPSLNLENPNSGKTKAYPDSNTTYVLEYLQPDLPSCYASDTLGIDVSLPVLEMMEDTSVCLKDSILLQPITSGSSIMWGDSTTSGSKNVYGDSLPSSGMTFTGKIIDSIGCQAMDSVFISPLPLPTPYLGPDTSICDNQSVNLSPDSSYSSYLWSDGNTSPSIVVDSSWGMGNHQVSLQVSDSNSCSGFDTVTVTINICTETSEDRSSSPVLKLYPNPTSSGELTLMLSGKFKAGVQATLFNLQGKIVRETEIQYPKEGNGPGSKRITISDLSTGVYQIMITTSNKVLQKKIVVE